MPFFAHLGQASAFCGYAMMIMTMIMAITVRMMGSFCRWGPMGGSMCRSLCAILLAKGRQVRGTGEGGARRDRGGAGGLRGGKKQMVCRGAT
eukprot:744808-Rhodomonas_salina.2